MNECVSIPSLSRPRDPWYTKWSRSVTRPIPSLASQLLPAILDRASGHVLILEEEGNVYFLVAYSPRVIGRELHPLPTSVTTRSNKRAFCPIDALYPLHRFACRIGMPITCA